MSLALISRSGLAVLCAILSTSSPATAQRSPPLASPAGVAVRHIEGTVHGFLRLSAEDGSFLADGDLLQVVRNGIIDSRMVFAFADSSFFEESVSFAQRDVFTMLQYHLVQRGPAFAMDLDVTLAQSGDYRVTATAHADGEPKQYAGTLDLPADTYNGMIINVAKNIAVGTSQTVHLVAFTPKPRLIGLEISGAPSAQPTQLGRRTESTAAYTLKPKLGAITGVLARLLGKMPPDSRAWFVTQDVPAFVRFEGPLYAGPVWRIELIGPTIPSAVPTRTPGGRP